MSDPLDQLRNVDLSHLSKQEAKEFTLLLEELDLRDKRDSSAATFYDFVLISGLSLLRGLTIRKWLRLSTRLQTVNQKD